MRTEGGQKDRPSQKAADAGHNKEKGQKLPSQGEAMWGWLFQVLHLKA
jgi:hypothetical protein